MSCVSMVRHCICLELDISKYSLLIQKILVWYIIMLVLARKRWQNSNYWKSLSRSRKKIERFSLWQNVKMCCLVGYKVWKMYTYVSPYFLETARKLVSSSNLSARSEMLSMTISLSKIIFSLKIIFSIISFFSSIHF